MYIYKTTNLINNKIYIGLSTKEVEESTDYYGSGRNIIASIKKHGKENFTKEILLECNTLEQLKLHEIKFIKEYKATDRSTGYNISPGGDTNPDTQRVGIYQYTIEGDLVNYFKTIQDAIKLIGDNNLYRKKQRDNRPIKGYWYTINPHTKADIISKHSRYVDLRTTSFKDAAAKRHSDPVLSQFYKDNMRRVRLASV